MKKAALVLLALLALLLLALKPVFNVSPAALTAAVEVATGLGAKLACSGRYITGLDESQVMDDLASYSTAFALVQVSYDDTARTARAELGGLQSRSARFRPGLGCTLELEGAEQLDGVTVTAIESPALPWPRGNIVDTLSPPRQQALEALLAQDSGEGFQTRALLQVRDGAIVAESYAPGFGESTPLLGWSMGKSVTAMLLGLLERDGLASVSRDRLFPEWAGDSRAQITLENLLHMSSGLAFDEDYAPGSDATRMLFAAPSAAAVALAQPAIHAPGSFFSYSSGTTNLLARLYQQRLGGETQAAADYLHQQLFAPLGMAHSIFEPDASGVFVGSSYIYASARDWARLGLLMLNEGEMEGRRILSRDWVRRAIAPNASRNDPRYGYQFWLNDGGQQLRWPDLPRDAYAMQGHRGQVAMIIPSKNTVIVRLGWSAAEYPKSSRFAQLLSGY